MCSTDCRPLPLVCAADPSLAEGKYVNEKEKEVLTSLLSKQLCYPMPWREVIPNVLANP